jgi:hypothetical protein
MSTVTPLFEDQRRRIARSYVDRFYVLAVEGRRCGGSYECELKVAGLSGNVYAVCLRDGVLTCDEPRCSQEEGVEVALFVFEAPFAQSPLLRSLPVRLKRQSS